MALAGKAFEQAMKGQMQLNDIRPRYEHFLHLLKKKSMPCRFIE